MPTLTEQLLKSPSLPAIADEIVSVLERERQRRLEFYATMNEDQKVEFINGEVVYQSPARHCHNMTRSNIERLVSTHVLARGLGLVLSEHALVSLARNDYEPDVVFFGNEKATQFRGDMLHYPAPDLVVEVLSPSTEAVDRGVKLEDYAAHGVAEYWIVDPDEEVIEQHVLDGKAYRLRLKVRDGEVDSFAINGLRFPARAAFDPAANLREVARLSS